MTVDPERVRRAADALPESMVLIGLRGEQKLKWVGKALEASGYPDDFVLALRAGAAAEQDARADLNRALDALAEIIMLLEPPEAELNAAMDTARAVLAELRPSDGETVP